MGVPRRPGCADILNRNHILSVLIQFPLLFSARNPAEREWPCPGGEKLVFNRSPA